MTITDIDRSLAVLAATRIVAEDTQDADGWLEAQERLDALLEQRWALTQRVDSGVAPGAGVTVDPLAVTWQHLADACVEGDQEHELRALAALARLTQRSGDAVVDEPAAR